MILKIITVEECPEGYPRLAAFLSSESSFSLYRSFSYAHSRVLLDLQAQVVQLERELEQLDLFDSQNSDTVKRRLGSKAQDDRRPRDDGERPRAEVLRELRERLSEYDELLVKARELQSFQRPSARDYRSVRTWFYNMEPLVEKESQFIYRKEDVISLRSGREWSTFDGWIESTLRRFDCSLLRVGTLPILQTLANQFAVENILLPRTTPKDQGPRSLLLLLIPHRALRRPHHDLRHLRSARAPSRRYVQTHLVRSRLPWNF